MIMTGSLDIAARLRDVGYIPDETLVIALQFTLDLERPLLLEGEAGVGKTEVARALSAVLETRLIRLQCYEGLDASNAIYEWNYQRQLLAIKAKEREKISADDVEEQIFSETYLLRRPLLEAISQPRAPVLLIDEIDRADEEFEAYLLEVLSDYQITVPELGTIEAKTIPHVVLTSNGTRELSDALRRRCLYAYVEFPSLERELEIVLSRIPGIEQKLAGQVVRFIPGLGGGACRHEARFPIRRRRAHSLDPDLPVEDRSRPKGYFDRSGRPVGWPGGLIRWRHPVLRC